MSRNWWRGLAQRWSSSLRSPRRSTLRRLLPLSLEQLEDRTMLTVQPLTLADSSFFSGSASGPSSNPSMSADGQLVVFESVAPNLVANDLNGNQDYHSESVDVFLYNRTTGVTSLLSPGPGGNAAGGCDFAAYASSAISPDGRYVAFEYSGDQLVQGVSGDRIYLRDLQTGTTTPIASTLFGGLLFTADSNHLLFGSP